ncbi:hypothetical protein EJ08DRAFT_650468 [Tothia fuscella]|uniref:Uncharacterized protein n=1 Tax=Tothia fuscella TaxID=1048955 RepID=A0A9P4NPQ8_9PEZI|nr:hypothetical protein EJ08DRAFT_650468 [Tothia fuscella]
MATQLAGSPVYLNGNGISTTESSDSNPQLEQFYAKIVQLHKDVVAGTHPRLKISTGKAAAPTSTSANPFSSNSTTNSQQHLPGDAHKSTEVPVKLTPAPNASTLSSSLVDVSQSVPSSKPSNAATPQHNLRPNPAGPAVIDPVLLEKSPALIQAEQELAERRNGIKAKLQNHQSRQADPVQQRQQEIAIQRSKYEKAIGLQVQMLKGSGALPLLPDIPLRQAQDIVPPVSGYKPPSVAQSPSSESFDENSYYSSKANSWSTEHTEPCHGDGNDSDAMIVSDEEEEEEDLYEPPPQVDTISGPSATDHTSTMPALHDPATQHDWEPEWDDEEEEDGDDYEPPAPMTLDQDYPRIPPPQQTASSHYDVHQHMQPPPLHAVQKYGRQGAGPTITENRIRSPMSVAVNQIQSPAAPQPSRISPLALGNMMPSAPPPFTDQRHAQNNPSVPNASSGAQAKPKQDRNGVRPNGKKRKRNATPERETRRSKKGKRRAITPMQQQQQPRKIMTPIRSPEPYIKPEPMSPPPDFGYADAAPSRRPSRIFREGPESPRIARPRSAYQSEYEQSPRAYRYADEDDRMAPPAPAFRRPERDTQDLRRVASLHYARRPVTPPQYNAYAPVERVLEPAPYEVVDRRPRASAYPEPDPYARTLMPPPPPRQIIMDQYGNKYYAEPVVEERVERRASVMPAPAIHGNKYYAEPVVEERVERRASAMPPPTTHGNKYYAEPVIEERVERRASAMPPPATHVNKYYAEPVVEERVERRASAMPPPTTRMYERAATREPQYDEYAMPPPPRARAYTQMPEPVLAPARERAYSRPPPPPARVASVQPGAGYARREMPPPPMSRSQMREPRDGDEYYSPAQPQRAPVVGGGGRRYAEERHGGERVDERERGRTPYGDGRRIVTYG